MAKVMHKQLFVLVLVGFVFIGFCTLSLFSSSSSHQNSISYLTGSGSGGVEDLVLSGRSFSIRIDDVIVSNISDRVVESLRQDLLQHASKDNIKRLPTIYFITPTYKRAEQIPDLTRLSQTLMHVPSLVWLVIEDAEKLDPQVAELLRRSTVPFVHLTAPMPKQMRSKKVKPRGVSNRNRGLQWIRENPVDVQGVVYFADDDNTYDLRLFDEIRSVKKVGMWPVGLITSLGISTPIVKDGKVVGFYDGWPANRKFPVDMASFALSVSFILEKSHVLMPYIPGYEEDRFLQALGVTKETIEPKADSCTKIYVWHTQTKKNKPPTAPNATVFGDSNVMKLYRQVQYTTTL